VASISDASFTKDGRYIISRDYLTLKIWDINMENKPVQVININDNLKSMLSELYESDCIFDKFETSVNATGDRIVTGCYGNQFSVWNKDGTKERSIHLKGEKGFTQNVDFDKKVLHCAWNPGDNTVALAAQAALYLYQV
jgi:serine/threonine-protein phosphatase 2A regulatory subunit B